VSVGDRSGFLIGDFGDAPKGIGLEVDCLPGGVDDVVGVAVERVEELCGVRLAIGDGLWQAIIPVGVADRVALRAGGAVEFASGGVQL
jgi:hypothetical protein